MKRRSRTVSASVRAFTLVEVLVVVAIIGILASLSVAGLRIAQIHAREGAVKHEISLLKAAAETFGREMGDFPPSRWSFFRVSGVNAENDGNEILLLCLLSRKKGGPFHEDFEEDRLLNADGDTLPPAALAVVRKELDPSRTSGALFEYTDAWGNPYVYIHHRDYGQKLTYRTAEGTKFEVEAAKSPTGEGHAAPSSFQIWSLGPDGVNQNGEGDDICSWKS